jgi:hypothetical protein
MLHSAAEAEAKQKAAEEEASNRAAAEAATGLLPTHHQHCNLFALIVAIITLFLLPHMMHSAAEAESKQKAAEEDNKKAVAEVAAGL